MKMTRDFSESGSWSTMSSPAGRSSGAPVPSATSRFISSMRSLLTPSKDTTRATAIVASFGSRLAAVSWMLPYDGLGRVRQGDGRGRAGSEPLGEPLRCDILRSYQRDQPADASLPISPRTGSERGLRRVSATPVSARERPAELRLRVLARIREGRLSPRTGVPDDEPDAAEHVAVVLPLEYEVPEAVLAPAVEPALDDLWHVGL